ncbi:MAG: twin-arginine translocase TatA/TatE family subunit [Patescibacteria group bacterium]
MPARIGLTELLLISMMLIVFFGSRKLPEFIKGVAEGVREFKRNASAKE